MVCSLIRAGGRHWCGTYWEPRLASRRRLTRQQAADLPRAAWRHRRRCLGAGCWSLANYRGRLGPGPVSFRSAAQRSGLV